MAIRHSIMLFPCVLLLTGCNTESSVKTDSGSGISIGMTRGQVVKKLGQPTTKQVFVKSDQPVWGVIESWLSDLENGDKVEIWNYMRSKGTFAVYFLAGSDEVWHTSFVGKNVRF